MNQTVDFSGIDGIETIVKGARKREQSIVVTDSSVNKGSKLLGNFEIAKGFHTNTEKYLALKKGSHIQKLRDEYNKTDLTMRDYRMTLLSSLIQEKLGLKKRTTKDQDVINEIIYELKKKGGRDASMADDTAMGTLGEGSSISRIDKSEKSPGKKIKDFLTRLDIHLRSHAPISKETIITDVDDLEVKEQNREIFDKIKKICKSSEGSRQETMVNKTDFMSQRAKNPTLTLFDQVTSDVIKDEEFRLMQKQIDETYGYHPDSLKYERVR